MAERSCSVENISKGKPIGIGSVTILPGETKSVPITHWGSPVLRMYADLGFLRIIEDGVAEKSGAAGVPDAAKESAPEVTAEDAAEALRKARLDSLPTLDETALGKLAEEIGVNPADCKDAADMRKKVKAALKK